MKYVDIILLEFAKSFIDERFSAEVFAEGFIRLWQIRRDKMPMEQKLQQNEFAPELVSCLSSLFLSADSYSPTDDPDYLGITDEEELRKEVSDLISEYLGYEFGD